MDNLSDLFDVVSSTSNQASHDMLQQEIFPNNMSADHSTSMFQMSSNYEYSGLTIFFLNV